MNGGSDGSEFRPTVAMLRGHFRGRWLFAMQLRVDSLRKPDNIPDTTAEVSKFFHTMSKKILS